ncbi:hypothetical protein YC2023_083413 [Brassica napus]
MSKVSLFGKKFNGFGVAFFDPGENQRLAFFDGSGPTMCLSLDLSDFPLPKAFITGKRDVALGVHGYGGSWLTEEMKTSPVLDPLRSLQHRNVKLAPGDVEEQGEE